MTCDASFRRDFRHALPGTRDLGDFGFMPVTPCYHHDYYHCYSAMIMQIMQLLFLRLLFWFLFAYFVEGTQL